MNPPDRIYFVDAEDYVQGPYSFAKITQFASLGIITPITPVAHEGESDWISWEHLQAQKFSPQKTPLPSNATETQNPSAESPDVLFAIPPPKIRGNTFHSAAHKEKDLLPLAPPPPPKNKPSGIPPSSIQAESKSPSLFAFSTRRLSAVLTSLTQPRATHRPPPLEKSTAPNPPTRPSLFEQTGEELPHATPFL